MHVAAFYTPCVQWQITIKIKESSDHAVHASGDTANDLNCVSESAEGFYISQEQRSLGVGTQHRHGVVIAIMTAHVSQRPWVLRVVHITGLLFCHSLCYRVNERDKIKKEKKSHNSSRRPQGEGARGTLVAPRSGIFLTYRIFMSSKYMFTLPLYIIYNFIMATHITMAAEVLMLPDSVKRSFSGIIKTTFFFDIRHSPEIHKFNVSC